MFYVAARPFAQEPFLTYEYNHNSDKTFVSITPFSGPSIVNDVSTFVGEIDTHPPAIYVVQAECQVWNQSRVRVRIKSAQAASSNNVTV